MDEQGLRKFVENMRANSMPDEEIERNLQIAGHDQKLIDSLLDKTPEHVAGKEHRQDDTPIIDPNNRPQIIKDRSAILEKQIQPTAEESKSVLPASEATPAELPSVADKLKINPQTAGMAPASINSPTTQVPAQEVTSEPPAPEVPAEPSIPEPQPTPAPEPAETNANSFDAVTAAATAPGLGMPQAAHQAPPPTPQPIYPEPTRGHVAHMQPAPNPLGGPNPQTDPFPEFISNPFSLFLYSIKKFATNAPFLIAAVLLGSALAIAFTKLVAFLAGQAVEIIGSSGAGFLFGDGGWGSTIGLFIIVVFIYDVFLALYVTLYRTLQLSITLDIARGDRPDFAGAFNRMFTWFTRIFAANLRLIIKLSIVVIIAGLLLLWMIISAFSGSLTISSLLPLYVLLYGSLFMILLIMIRNSFVHLLMLENGTNRPSDSARDSLTMVKQPRQKYFELFAWLGIATILYSAFSILHELLFPGSFFNPGGLFAFDFESDFSSTNWGRDIVGVLFTIIVVSIHDLGISRHFATARGMLKTAQQAPPISPLNLIVIVLAIASAWGSARFINNIRSDRFFREYEESSQSQQLESSGTTRPVYESRFDPDDWDNNGIPDDEQCSEDTYAVPDFVEYNEETDESIYVIECL